MTNPQHSQSHSASPLEQKFNGLFGFSADLPKIIELDVSRVSPNPNQPRKFFDEESLADLADSIQAQGLLQPILVKPLDNGNFEIVAGERRYRAHQKLSKQTIAAIIVTSDTDEIAIIENVQREDLKPLELAESLLRLSQTHGYTNTELAKVIGKPRSTISEILSLNKLPESIKQDYKMPITDRLIDATTNNENHTLQGLEPASKTFLVELAKLNESDQLRVWAAYKQGQLATVDSIKALIGKPNKSSVTITNGSTDTVTGVTIPLFKKHKRVFHTKHQAIVIVQAEGDALSDNQVQCALSEVAQRMFVI